MFVRHFSLMLPHPQSRAGLQSVHHPRAAPAAALASQPAALPHAVEPSLPAGPHHGGAGGAEGLWGALEVRDPARGELRELWRNEGHCQSLYFELQNAARCSRPGDVGTDAQVNPGSQSSYVRMVTSMVDNSSCGVSVVSVFASSLTVSLLFSLVTLGCCTPPKAELRIAGTSTGIAGT